MIALARPPRQVVLHSPPLMAPAHAAGSQPSGTSRARWFRFREIRTNEERAPGGSRRPLPSVLGWILPGSVHRGEEVLIEPLGGLLADPGALHVGAPNVVPVQDPALDRVIDHA